jgi:hypothetical protein
MSSNKARDFNRTRDDSCAIQRHNCDNNKRLKFVTTSHRDLLEAKDKLNYYGMTIKDHLFVPSEEIDKDSFLRYGENGGVMTNCNIKNIFGQLPFPTMPAKFQTGHGNLNYVSEDMRFPHLPPISNKQSCNPREEEYQKRTFYIFNDKLGIEEPKPVRSIETQEFGPRGGMSSRFLSKTE